MSIAKLYRKIVENNLDDFKIEVYSKKYQNQVMTLGFRTLTEEVDERNRENELLHLAKVFTPSIYDKHINNNNNLWVLTNDDKVYAYISVRIDNYNYKATLTGFYIIPVLRGLKFAEKLLSTVIDFITNRGCKKLTADSASYSLRAIGFYTKYFKIDKEFCMDGVKCVLFYKDIN